MPDDVVACLIEASRALNASTRRDLRWDVDDIRYGPDRVVGFGRITGGGQSSAVGSDLRGGFAARLRDGLICQLHAYAQAADAPRAAGLADGCPISPGSRPPA